MGWFDGLFGGGSDNAQTAQAPATVAPAAPNGSPVPNYSDWFKNYINAAAAHEKAYGGNNTWAWLTGQGRDAAIAKAKIDAPAEYYKLLAGQAAAQTGQLGVSQRIGALNDGGFNVDPNNIVGSMSAQSGAPSPSVAPTGAPAPAVAPSQPASGAPSPAAAFVPQPPQAPQPPSPVPNGAPSAVAPTTANPLDQYRAMMMRFGRSMVRYPDLAKDAVAMMNAARYGIPEGSGLDTLPSGKIGEITTGQPVTDIQKYVARGKGLSSSAEAWAKVAPELRTAGGKANIEAAHDLKEVTDRNGNKTLVPRADIINRTGRFAPGGDLAGVSPTTGFADNPYRAPQIKEQEEAQKAGNDASIQQNAVDQLGAAIDKFGKTGPFAEKALNVLQALDNVGLLDKDMHDKLGAGALSQMNSQTIVAAVAKAASAGRVPLGIYNQIAKTKPGILVSNPKLQLEALHQDFQRAKDLASFTTEYYADHKNATKLDAQTAFEKSHPMAQYQSYVMPLTAPTKNGQVDKSALKSGYAYRMRDGATAVFDGTGFAPYRGLGQE